MNKILFYVMALGCIAQVYFAQVCFAQVNTEELRVNDLGKSWKHELNVATDWAKGNNNFSQIAANWRTDYLKEPFQTFLVIKYAKNKSDGVVSQNEGFAHVRALYRVVPRLKIEAYAQKEFNEFLRLEDRQLVGSGIRWKIIPDSVAHKSARLYLGIGAMYEAEKIKDLPSENTQFVRSTNYISYKMDLSEEAHLNTVAYFQPALTNLKDYRFLWQFNLGFDITSHLAIETSFNYRFDSQPPPDVVAKDAHLTTGIKIVF